MDENRIKIKSLLQQTMAFFSFLKSQKLQNVT